MFEALLTSNEKRRMKVGEGCELSGPCGRVRFKSGGWDLCVEET